MKINILNVNIDKINYSETISKIESFINSNNQHYIVTPNPEIILKSMLDSDYRAILNNADIATPDGFGLILASIFLGDAISQRVTGSNLAKKILELANQKQYKIFFLGGISNSAKLAKENIEKEYKNIQIVGALEGFKDISNPSEEENNGIIKQINESSAQILFVCFGAPFQEKWINKNLEKIKTIKVALGLGGTIDFLSGKIKRSPIIFQKLGLEWLWRLIQEPYRLKRIFNAVIIFSIRIIQWKMHLKKPYRKNALGVIISPSNKILILKRKDTESHWQFPQGGIEENESPEEGVLREIKEETGLTKLEILGKANKMHTYYWPIVWKKNIDKRKKNYNKQFCGQKQIIFFLKQTENENPNPEEEHDDFKWVDINELKNWIHPIRRETLNIALSEINKYLN